MKIFFNIDRIVIQGLLVRGPVGLLSLLSLFLGKRSVSTSLVLMMIGLITLYWGWALCS